MTNDRLRLVPLSEATIRALYSGEVNWAGSQPELATIEWPPDDRRVLRYRTEVLDARPTEAPFLLHAALENGVFVGRIGCHAGPDLNGTVEIGYAVVAHARGRGLGRQVVELFLGWLATQGVTRVEASVGPDNEPSLRILHRLGFTEFGERWDDEDGRELLLMTQLPQHVPRPHRSLGEQGDRRTR